MSLKTKSPYTIRSEMHTQEINTRKSKKKHKEPFSTQKIRQNRVITISIERTPRPAAKVVSTRVKPKKNYEPKLSISYPKSFNNGKSELKSAKSPSKTPVSIKYKKSPRYTLENLSPYKKKNENKPLKLSSTLYEGISQFDEYNDIEDEECMAFFITENDLDTECERELTKTVKKPQKIRFVDEIDIESSTGDECDIYSDSYNELADSSKIDFEVSDIKSDPIITNEDELISYETSILGDLDIIVASPCIKSNYEPKTAEDIGIWFT